MTTDSLPLPEYQDITVEMLLNDQVICITVKSSSRATVDRFAEIIQEKVSGLPTDEVVHFLCDFSESFAAFNTPYGKQRMRELMQVRSDLTTYSAILVPHSFVMQIARLFLNSLGNTKARTRLCASREEALTWLREMISRRKAA
jgi:hypothetical protein